MKRKTIKSILCTLLVFALLAAPMSALAANVGYILKVSVPDSKGTFLRSTTDPHNLNSSRSTVIASLRNGTKVLYWGESSGKMLKVMTVNGKVGYVYANYLQRYGAMNTRQLYVVSSNTAVYRRSGSSLRRAGTAKKGVPVIVYRTNGSWAYVRSVTGASGFIKTSALKKF